MHHLARLSLAVGGLSLALPAMATAQHASSMPMPLAPASHSSGEYSVPTGVVVTEKESKAMEAQLRRLGPPRVVSETVVTEGQPVYMTTTGAAPGRAVATDVPTGPAMATTAEPVPIGVMQTNFAPAPVGIPAQRPGQAPPGLGMPGMGAPGSSPMNPMMSHHGVPNSLQGGGGTFMASSPAPRPRVLTHLFGLDGIANSFRDAREAKAEARRRREIMQNYTPATMPNEVPASAVYGRRGH